MLDASDPHAQAIFGTTWDSLEKIAYWSDLFDLDELSQKVRARGLHTKPRSDALFLDFLSVFYSSHAMAYGSNLLFIVPAWFTPFQRLQYEACMRPLGFRDVRFLDDVDAIAYAYSIDGHHAPQTVLFVDIGVTSARAFVLSFRTKTVVHRLAYEVNFDAGGDQI